MKIGLKWIVFLEAVLIVLLSVIMFLSLKNTAVAPNNEYRLLAPSVASNVLKPQSFLILNFNSLQKHLYQIFQNNSLDISMYVHNLRDGNNFQIQGYKGAFPASLNKIPIAVLILNKIERGELSYDTPIKIDKTLLDKYSNKMYFENDQLPLRVLLENMLKESDTAAFYILLKEVNINDLDNLMTYYDVDPAHSYSYSSESEMENNALLTPQSFSNMFLSLYYSTILTAEDSEYILDLLANTSLNMSDIAKIPNNVTVSHKWGYYPNSTDNLSIFNDCGIMYIGNGRILYCITIRNQTIPNSIGILGGVVGNIYTYYTEQTHALSTFKENFTASTK